LFNRRADAAWTEAWALLAVPRDVYGEIGPRADGKRIQWLRRFQIAEERSNVLTCERYCFCAVLALATLRETLR
jgi:hypothetical protein